MSFSGQILQFLGVASIYIGFTFVWAWYKGRQESNPRAESESAAGANSTSQGGEH